MSPTREQNRYCCKPTEVIVFIEQQRSEITGTLVEVSRSGMKIRLRQALLTGTPVCIILPKCRAGASVRYCKPSEREFFDIGVAVLNYERSQAVEP